MAAFPTGERVSRDRESIQASVLVLLSMMLPIAVAQTAAAQSRSACVARSGGVDLCERARAIEREVAPQLPAKVHPNATFQSVSAVGPRIVVTGVLHAGRRGDPALLKLRAIMPGVTRSLLCRQEPTAGFVRQCERFATSIGSGMARRPSPSP